MTHKVIIGVAKLLKPLFVNGFTREFTRSFMDPDVRLELELNEICSNCPLHTTTAHDNGSGLDLICWDFLVRLRGEAPRTLRARTASSSSFSSPHP